MTTDVGDQPEEKPTGDYQVGYGKPPKEHQFQPGKSGNPAGKPKGAKNMSTLFKENFEQKQPVKLNGKTKKMTPMEITFRQIAQKAMTGDYKFVILALTLCQKHGQTSEEFSTQDLELNFKLLADFLKKQNPEGWEDDDETQ